jgi:hypothetical protein
MTAELPQVQHPVVWHVGHLERGDANPNSLEGAALSVSVHPRSWTRIARLGGAPTWELTAADGHGTFCDAARLGPAHVEHVTTWAVDRGLLETATLWAAPIHIDDELDGQLLCDTEAEALDEASDTDLVCAVTTWVATGELLARQRWTRPARGAHTMDLALITYVDDCCEHLDGVWFDEVHDPAALSAPRGALLERARPHWRTVIVDGAPPQPRPPTAPPD